MIKIYLQEQMNFDLTFERKSAGASGFDLYACMSSPRRTIPPGQRWNVSTGVHVAMPDWCEAQVRPRSGWWRDHGVGPLQGTVDSDYRGEIKITLANLGTMPVEIAEGERVAQLVFAPVFPNYHYHLLRRIQSGPHEFMSLGYSADGVSEPWFEMVDSLEALGTTDRGSGGHGSTGR